MPKRRLNKYIPLIICLLIACTETNAATPGPLPKGRIKGKVIDSYTKYPIAFATLLIKETGVWASSNEQGDYLLQNLPQGKYTLECSVLGYKTIQHPIIISGEMAKMDFALQEDNLQLETVIVSAQRTGGLHTGSLIEQAAIEHVQPSSLSDIMQLLPGYVTQNPNLNEVNSIVIRDMNTNEHTNAMGTAIILDGATLSNNNNLQFDRTSPQQNTGSANAYYGSSAASGVDTRQIPTDNIESVEVIRGVASAEYGDLTSGMVIVKTKAGFTPWSIRLKTDPATKQIAVGKGFKLKNKGGALNFDADYLLSYGDTRSTSEAYHRYNLKLGYSNILFSQSANPLKFDVKLHGNYAKMSNEADADRFLDDYQAAEDQSLLLTTNGTWMLNRPWITNLSFTLSGSYGKQTTRQRIYHGSYSGARFTNALETGESIGYIIPAGGYYSDESVQGLPYDFQAKIMATQNGSYGPLSNFIKLGMEWVSQGNHGEGKTTDPLKPYNPNGSPLRTRSYKDIPALNRYILFAEDKLTLPLGSTVLELQAGLRLTNIQPDGLFNTSFKFKLEPRFNAGYTLLKNSMGFNKLSIRSSWGMQSKMPTLMYLYPDPVYLDKSSYSYNDPANSYTLSVFSTKKNEDLSNPDLKTPTSYNFEAAVDFDLELLNGNIAYFNERLRDGYSFQRNYQTYSYRQYNGGQASGAFPVYENGEVRVNGNPVGYKTDTVFMAYNLPSNGINYNKWGIEYSVKFAPLKAIRTTIEINGAYMHIKRFNSNLMSDHSALIVRNKEYPYAGIYGGATTVSNGSIDDRLNMSIRFITHIPAIRMVVTLTAEGVFIDRTRSISEYNGEVMAYYYDDNGHKITGEQVYDDNTHLKYVNPLYYVDMHGNRQDFTEAMEKDSRYAELIARNNYANVFAARSYPFYGLLNLRISKEFGRWATVSFYANNFLNIAGRVKDSVREVYVNQNIPLYFGAEIKLSF